MFRHLIKHLESGQSLSTEQVANAIEMLVEEMVPVDKKADFLAALAKKGETADEILAFCRELHARSIRPLLAPDLRAREIVDVCGTGGDRLNTFNISTTVSLLTASASACVAKHGNRAVTSRSGSADVLEALGIPIDLTPDEAAAWLKRHQFAFFFAPNFHPAFKHIAPARRLCSTRGIRTIFNFLGPLLNPAQPTGQLIGVPKPELCEPVARALRELGAKRGMIVSGKVRLAYLDEISPISTTHVVRFGEDGKLETLSLSPADFGITPCSLADLAGDDAQTNAKTVADILHGREKGPKRNTVLINAAAALTIAGAASSLSEGMKFAAELIDSGRAGRKLDELIEAGSKLRSPVPATA